MVGAGRSGARRVLFLTSDLGGGTGDHLLAMIDHWDPQRWRARIASERRLRSRRSSAVPVDVIGSRSPIDRFPVAQVRRLRQIARLVADYRPGIVHTYFYWSIMYGRILKRLGLIEKLVENREDEGFSWKNRDYLLLRLTRTLPDRVVCVSEAVRKVVLAREGLDPDRVVVIHNGVESPEAISDRGQARRELGVDPDQLLVGMVSNLNRQVKGVGYFVEAMPAITAAVPSVRFVIFGRGKYEDRLRHRAQELGVAGRLTFAGFKQDIHRFYPAFDVSVLTSLSEGLSISLLDSMSHGLPVVVTEVGGNPEVVVDGETGFLVPPRDTETFARRVIELLQEPALRARLGRAARSRVDREFRLERTAQRYTGLYEGLLRDGTPVRRPATPGVTGG